MITRLQGYAIKQINFCKPTDESFHGVKDISTQRQGYTRTPTNIQHTHTLPKTGVLTTTTMRATKNSTKDGESSDDSNVLHLDVIREEEKGDELPEVTASRTPFRNNRGIEPFEQLGISLEPGLLDNLEDFNLEDFTPRQETFLTTLLEGTTSRLIDADQIAVKGQQEEIERL